MTSHFLYLILHSTRNLLLRQLRRLRNPRYAIAALIGFAYFFFLFGGYRIGEVTHQAGPDFARIGRNIGPLMIGLLAAWWWLWGGHRHALALLPPERDLLVPAPISRRQLIQFKVMQAQTSVVFSALVTSLFMRGLPVPWPLRFISAWVLFATLHQHQVAASLVHASAEQQGRRGLRANIVPLALFATAFVVLAASVIRAIVDIRAATSGEFIRERLSALLIEPGVMFALAPFRAVLAPTLAADLSAWAQSFVVAVLVLAAHYLWLQRTDAAFEEAAAEVGAKQAQRLSAVKTGGLTGLRFTKLDRPKKLAQPWLPLHPHGQPAYAVFWKNVVFGQRAVRPLGLAILVIILACTIGVISVLSGDDDPPTLIMGTICLALSALYTIGGPIAVRHDLRTDLRNIDLLRTYPVRGRDLVAAEVAGTTFLITLPQSLLVTIGLALLGTSDALLAWQAAALLVTYVFVAPVVNLLLVTIQNAIALLFPAWTTTSDMPGGMESIGQNVLTMLATMILFLVSLIPPLVVGGAVAGPLYLRFGEWAAVPGAVAVIAALAVQTGLVIMWLGSLYDSTDPVEAGLLR